MRAALEAHGESISALAHSIGDSQQTVSLICRGVTRRTRRSRLDAIAKTLDVPPEWLTGEMTELLGVGWWKLGDTETIAEWQLAVARWTHQVTTAHLRDAKASGRSLEQTTREGIALSCLIHPGIWRDLLLEDEWRDRDEPSDPIFITGNLLPFARMLLAVLDPWIKGTNRLNYANLMNIMGAFVNMAIGPPDASSINQGKPKRQEGLGESDAANLHAPDGKTGAASKRKK